MADEKMTDGEAELRIKELDNMKIGLESYLKPRSSSLEGFNEQKYREYMEKWDNLMFAPSQAHIGETNIHDPKEILGNLNELFTAIKNYVVSCKLPAEEITDDKLNGYYGEVEDELQEKKMRDIQELKNPFTPEVH